MGLKLFELSSNIKDIEARLDAYAAEHEGDITDFPMADALDELTEERDEKLLSLGEWWKEMDLEADAIAEEAKRLSERASVLKNKAKRIKQYIAYNLGTGNTLRNARCEFKWRSSKAVRVDVDPNELVPKYQSIKVEANKTALKKDLDAGIDVKGAEVVVNHNLQIK